MIDFDTRKFLALLALIVVSVGIGAFILFAPTFVWDAEGLNAALSDSNASDTTVDIVLISDINMSEVDYKAPRNVSGAIDGRGHTIENLDGNLIKSTNNMVIKDLYIVKDGDA